MSYTVARLSKIAGVSVRTLHYYDEIGLLTPSFTHENGYRYYEEKELLKLQQILFFRELEFSLEDISQMVNAPDFNVQEALVAHKKLLELKKARIDNLLDTIDITIHKLEGGETMTNDDLFASLTDDQIEEYKKEAKQRWGNTDAYKQSAQRTKNWTKQDYKKIQEDGNALTQELADAMDKDVSSEEVQALIERHHQGIEVFYDCPPQMYRGLANMYVEDPRFTKVYDKFKPGLAEFVKKAIYFYCDTKEEKR